MSDARRTRLLVLTSTFPRWRGDTCPMFVADLCAGLAKTMDVTVLAPASRGAAAYERRDGYHVRRFRYSWPAATQRLADGAIMPNIRRNPLLLAQVPIFILAQLYAAWRLLRQEPFDAVHAHWVVPQGLVAAVLKRRFGLPLIATTHGSDIYTLKWLPALWLKRWVLRNSDHVTAVSTALATEVRTLGVAAEDISILPMGVDTLLFNQAEALPALRRDLGGPLLLFVGRLAEIKGARYAIEALPRILETHPRAQLIIVGDGPERPRLEQLVAEIGVTERVIFTGAVRHADLPAYFASSDVFIGPSIAADNGETEAFGLVFTEALASGVPVIATDAGGIGDVVQDGETGLVVPQRDPAAIGDAVCRLLADAELQGRLRRRGRRSVQSKFDQRVLHAKYAVLIERAAA